MISDVLSEAAHEIREYQKNMPDCYEPIREKIEAVLAAMDELRIELDTPPTDTWVGARVAAMPITDNALGIVTDG